MHCRFALWSILLAFECLRLIELDYHQIEELISSTSIRNGLFGAISRSGNFFSTILWVLNIDFFLERLTAIL